MELSFSDFRFAWRFLYHQRKVKFWFEVAFLVFFAGSGVIFNDSLSDWAFTSTLVLGSFMWATAIGLNGILYTLVEVATNPDLTDPDNLLGATND